MGEKGKKEFRNGKIYFIGNYIDNDIYIGSSCQSLLKRFQKHKDSIRDHSKKHRKLYVKMRELGVEHFYIEEIEKCPCDDIEELRKREGHYIKERQPVLNKQIPTRTREEYYQEHKKEVYEKYKRYREENPEKVKSYQKDYAEKNKEKLQTYQENYRKEYVEQLKTWKTKKVNCECGGKYTLSHKAEHLRSKKHQNYLNNNIENVQKI